MQCFTDIAGRAWKLGISVGTVKRVRARLADRLPGRAIDLLHIEEGRPPLVSLLSTDAELLVDVIFEALQSTPENPDVDAVAFAEAMGGDAMLAATAAFWSELRDFFRAVGRIDLAQVVCTQANAFRLIMEKQIHELEQLDLPAIIDRTYANEKQKVSIPGSESTNSPALPASTPTPSPGGNSAGWPAGDSETSGTAVPG